jgi:hypothetical protein
MSMLRAAVTAAVIGTCASSTNATTIGSDWRNLPTDMRSVYVIAVIDAWSIQIDVLRSKEVEERDNVIISVIGPIIDCIHDRRMPPSQIVGIVKKYSDDHPEKWHTAMPDLVFAAMMEACRK